MEKTRSTAEAQPTLFAVLAAFAAVYFIWGSTYLGILFAIETIPPFTMAGLRFLSAGAILFAWTYRRGAPWPTWVQWRSALVVGGLLLVFGNGLLTWAEKIVPSGVAALIVATVPLWMVVLEALRPGGNKPGAPVVLGLLLGLAGIAILIGPEQIGGAPVDPLGAAVICIASFSWALGSIYSKSAPQVSSTLQNVGMQMLLGGTLLLAGGFALGERIDLAGVSARSAWALLYLSIVGGIVSYSAYVWLLKVSTPAKVSTYAYVNPVVAVLLGWGLAGEALDSRVLLASIAVITAVFLITSARKRQPREEGNKSDELRKRK
ncbi:MAG: EamA family transporter [Deltaproteobacteria bacterium]|nr:EamA family transporter [Deltaproteobacteria bacterium]